MEDDARARGPPHVLILGLVVGSMLLLPSLLGEGGALVEMVSELLGPGMLMALPILLLLAIRFLSSDRAVFVSSLFSGGEPNSIHRVGGSPVGVVFILILTLLLLNYKVSLFGEDDSEE
ncbi:uncharacterized protein LOC18430357 [Amborella trichopoda]|uniref:Uncharacterized protein n=1 Tax=Amborella trichopoda TaxID=13333 RepID=W1NXC3_AMBTC|nr:uncharacterized protein LOC18430357 [Amborella trichopoda]ERN02252.1 hypothetical protein AMTR_s00045p00228470 [Amborella trichopoda]|eukprot:XP_006840577.1 uncharacterized protein LOC18430357 [Amborella trichopoda]